MKKTVIALAALIINLQAACVRIDCEPSVNMAVINFQTTLQQSTQEINSKLNTLDKNYEAYNTALINNNKLYDENIKLKAEYLLILKQINHTMAMNKNEIKE
ncbi:MAG: hypothetical protein A3F91_09620 [Flavobacteria bacterium RIFCSPLOWO2_12_FULL_35_11]|nr:MAG: hypothetical protein A3F91_09620 [Flavobacteria bacterium RIFCSPLOWO2_12_FULL_35_11]